MQKTQLQQRESSALFRLLLLQLSVLLTSGQEQKPTTIPWRNAPLGGKEPTSPSLYAAPTSGLLLSWPAAEPSPPLGPAGGWAGGGRCSRGRQRLLTAAGRAGSADLSRAAAGAAEREAAVPEWVRPVPGYSPSPVSGAEVSSPDGPGQQRGGGGGQGPRRQGAPGAPPRAGAAPGSRALCAPASARRRGGQAGRRAPWLVLQGAEVAAAALPAPARPLPGRGVAEKRGCAGDGGCAARGTHGGHGHLPSAPAPPRPSGKGNSGRAGATEKNGPASRTRPQRTPAGTARPESSRVRAAAPLKPRAGGRGAARPGPPTALPERRVRRGPGAPPLGRDCSGGEGGEGKIGEGK